MKLGMILETPPSWKLSKRVETRQRRFSVLGLHPFRRTAHGDTVFFEVPMAREHRKPIFNLTPADGAVGSHAGAVRDAERDFRKLAGEIAARMGIQV